MISENNAVGNDNAAAIVKPKEASAAETSAADFQSFLKLLTAQLRNQDPLSPLDGTEFVAQLASFSAVEQQVATNTKLDALVSNLIGSNLESATRWIGKEVEIASGATRFEGEALEYQIPKSGVPGAQVEVSIADANGKSIYVEKLGAGKSTFTWDGKTSSSSVAANGNYNVSVNYIKDEAVVETKSPIVVAKVSEARLVDSSVKLALANGAFVDPTDVLAVREAGN